MQASTYHSTEQNTPDRVQAMESHQLLERMAPGCTYNYLPNCARCSGAGYINAKYEGNRYLISPVELQLMERIYRHTGKQADTPHSGWSHWTSSIPPWLQVQERWSDCQAFGNRVTNYPNQIHRDQHEFTAHRIFGLKSNHCHHNAWAMAWQFPDLFECWTGLAVSPGHTWVRHSWLVHRHVTGKRKRLPQIHECGRWTFEDYIGIQITQEELCDWFAVGNQQNHYTGKHCAEWNEPEFTTRNWEEYKHVRLFGVSYYADYSGSHTKIDRRIANRKLFSTELQQ